MTAGRAPLAGQPGRITSLGIDIGDTTGLLLASWAAGVRQADFARAFQCDRGSAPDLLRWVLREYGYLVTCGQLEAFVSGPRSAALHGTSATAIRAQVTGLTEVAAGFSVVLARRPAANVKNWATDARLERAGLLEVTAGQRHARDGARHALYAAVHDRGLADPLSRRIPGTATARGMTMEADGACNTS